MVYLARPSVSLSESLSPSRRRWPRPSCSRPYACRWLEDFLGCLVRVSGSLSSLWAAIADRSHASRRASSASLRALSCARLSHLYLYGHKLATVDLLNLRHGAIFSPPVPLTRPRSAYTDPELTWMAAPTPCDILRHSSSSYDGIYRTKMKLFLLGPRWTTLDHLRSCWTTFEHLG